MLHLWMVCTEIDQEIAVLIKEAGTSQAVICE